MQTVSTQALSCRTSTAALASRAKRTARQTGQPVMATAVQGKGQDRNEQKGPNPAVMHSLAAVAAVQLALGGPAFAQDPLPASAESQRARDAVNKETDQAPGFGDIGKNLGANLFGGSRSAPDVGQAKGVAKQAADKAKNAAPDLSAGLPDSAESQRGRDAVNKETDNAPGIGDIGKNLSRNLGGGGGGQAKDAAKQAADKAKNAAPDLSAGLPDSAESQRGRDAVNRETNNAPGIGDIGKNLGRNLGGGSGSAGQAKDAAKQAADKAKNAAPDLSAGLPDSAESQRGRDAVNRETDNAPGIGDIGKNLSRNLGGGSGNAGQAKEAAKQAADKAKNAAPDLSVAI